MLSDTGLLDTLWVHLSPVKCVWDVDVVITGFAMLEVRVVGDCLLKELLGISDCPVVEVLVGGL